MLANDSYEQLEKAGLKPGQVVWDIGCGTGTMTEYLAKSVGSSGHVYAMDISYEQIKIAEKRIADLKLTNVTFIQDDIATKQDFPAGQADIVYGRFIMMHLVDPGAAIKKLHALLKPGGAVALQDSILSTLHASHPLPALTAYLQAILNLGRVYGVDYDTGAKLERLCQEASFSKTTVYYLNHKLPASDGKRALLERGSEWLPKAVVAGVATNEEVEQWLTAFANIPEDDPKFYVAMAKQGYVVAYK